MKYDLSIALRICPALSKTVVGFKDKIDLVAVSCRSLRRALEGVRWKIAIILDGCPSDYRLLMEDVFRGSEMLLCETPSIGNQRTYDKQVDLLLAEKEAKYVYFAEDDYIYAPEAIKAMLDWMSHDDVDFVTPLDHPGSYIPDNTASQTRIRVSSFRHWREVGTTCLTFMTTREMLRMREKTFRHFSRHGEEGTQWIAFTHEGTHNPLVLFHAFFKLMMRSKCHFGHFMPLCAWRHHWVDLLFRRKCRLWSPIPSLAIHCSNVSLPPFSSAILPDAMSHFRKPMEELACRFISEGVCG